MLLDLIALALVPCFILVHAIYVLDRYEKEPVGNLVRYLVGGAVAAPVAAVIQGVIDAALGRSLPGHIWALVLMTVLGVGLVEEGVKLLALVLLARRDRHLNEPFDWVVYSVSVALGFAAFENVAYVLLGGPVVGVGRAFTAVPAHALDGTLMGYHLAVASMGPGPHALRSILALVEPTLWHGAYDSLLMGVANGQVPLYGVYLWIGLMIAQWGVGVRRVQRLRTERPGHRVPPILYPLLVFRRVQWPEGRPPRSPRRAQPVEREEPPTRGTP